MKKRILAYSIAIITFSFVIASASTIHVPLDQPTIQAGIDASISGDTVLVEDGTYTGLGNRDIDFGGKNIVLKSENGASYTIIDCQGDSSNLHRGFIFQNGEDSTSVVDGFTITNGYVLSCGIRCTGQGGGVYCTLKSTPSIRNNTIKNCRAYYGGGISCWDTSNAVISDNFISNNTSALGGGIYCFRASPSIYRNVIVENLATSRGGGIHCYESFSRIVNNTIAKNTKHGLSTAYSYLWVEKTIIAFNGGPSTDCFTDYFSFPTLICCNIFGNDSGNWVSCIENQETTNNNYSADPLFCDTSASDYHLGGFSACLPSYSPCGVLVGALGKGCSGPNLCADANGDSVVTIEDVEFLEAYYFSCSVAPDPVLPSDLNCDGVIDIGDIVTLERYLNGTGPAPCCMQQ